MSKLNSNHGFISLLYSIGDTPLDLWSKYVSPEGRVRRIEDESLNGDRVIEIKGPENLQMTTNISCPANPIDSLHIKLPILVIILKNLKAAIKIDFQLIDEEDIRRRFVLSTAVTNGNKSPSVDQEPAKIFLKLEDDWNCLEIDLKSLCQSIYRTKYRALQRLIIHQNCRLRRIYLQDRHYDYNETPIQLCQAFFDMYMLKWGINFVEKSCQTGVTSADSKDDENVIAGGTGAQQSIKSLSIAKLCNSKKTLLSESKRSMRQKNSVSNIDKKKKSKGTSAGIGMKRKISKAENEKDPSITKIASTLASIEKVEKNDSEKEGEIFRKWPYNYQQFQHSAQNTTMKLKINEPAITKANSIIDATKFPKILDSVNHQLPKLSEQAMPLEISIPPEVEKEAAAETDKIVKSTKSKILTTDEAVRNFLELRHVINRKMLENFRSLGLTMTEVELSIYNSKNRQNSYGQGKIIEKHRTSIEKACNVETKEEMIKNKV